MENMINNINVYRRIARNNYDSYLECERRRSDCLNHAIAMGKDGREFSYKLLDKMYENAVTAIVFSALSLEAFINDFLVFYLGKKEFELLDKLEIKAKILIGTKMVTGKDFPRDKNAFANMTKLISCRNKLVHAKSVDAESEASKILLEIEKKEIEDAVSTYELIVKEIDNLNTAIGIKQRYWSSDEQLRDWYYLNA